jgi:hypothetical protein
MMTIRLKEQQFFNLGADVKIKLFAASMVVVGCII